MDPTANIQISDGEDPASVKDGIRRLVDTSGWELQNGDAIQKTFHCKTWTKIQDFFNGVATKCKEVNHHPKIEITYGSITFLWTTHSPPGLSQKDIQMADFCEFWAGVVKTVPAGEGPSCLKPKAA